MSHISVSGRGPNVIGAWALLLADRQRGAVEAESGVSGSAPAALIVIHDEPGLGIEALRRALTISQPGAVRVVDRLEELGWVRRAPGADARSVALHLTAAGRRRARRMLRARAAVVSAALAELPPDLRRALETAAEHGLAAATHSRADLHRLCRLCERAACSRCPVAGALA